MTRFIALLSGKGGVGKTTATINISQALVDMGRKVVVVDANLVTPNVGIHLGLTNPRGTLNQFLRKEKSLKEVMHLHESGLSVIPASCFYAEFQKTNPQKLSEVFEHLDDTADFVVVDSPSGLGFDVQHVLKNCDEAIVVVTPTLSSLIDALKSVELAKSTNTVIAGVMLNMTHRGRNELSPQEVESVLGYPVIANVRMHRNVRKAAFHQLPVTYAYPRSRAAKQFHVMAAHLCFGETNK